MTQKIFAKAAKLFRENLPCILTQEGLRGTSSWSDGATESDGHAAVIRRVVLDRL